MQTLSSPGRCRGRPLSLALHPIRQGLTSEIPGGPFFERISGLGPEKALLISSCLGGSSWPQALTHLLVCEGGGGSWQCLEPYVVSPEEL